MTNRRTSLRRMLRDSSAVAMTEFALATPLVLTLGLWGLETANLAITHMRVSQAAMHLADNASRIGETSSLSRRKIYEDDINDFFLGSNYQAGDMIDLYEFGRVIISSLQVEEGTDMQQYIAWQRCKGRGQFQSDYGVQDTGKGDPSFQGMGPVGEEVFALKGEAVMFVEISYEYQPIVTDAFLDTREIKASAAFTVRADRDLSQIYQRNTDNPDDIARCDVYDAYKSIPAPRKASGGWGWVFSDDPDAVGGTPPASTGGPSGTSGTSGASSPPSSASSGGAGGGSSGGASGGSSGGNSGRWCPTWNWWCD